MAEWRAVQLSRNLVDDIEKIVKSKSSTYHSISEYVTYSIRKEIERVRSQK